MIIRKNNIADKIKFDPLYILRKHLDPSYKPIKQSPSDNSNEEFKSENQKKEEQEIPKLRETVPMLVRNEKKTISMKEFTARIAKDEREFYLRKRSEPEDDAQNLKDAGISKRFFHKIKNFMDFQKIKDKQAEKKSSVLVKSISQSSTFKDKLNLIEVSESKHVWELQIKMGFPENNSFLFSLHKKRKLSDILKEVKKRLEESDNMKINFIKEISFQDSSDSILDLN